MINNRVGFRSDDLCGTVYFDNWMITPRMMCNRERTWAGSP